jgi:DnaJ domain
MTEFKSVFDSIKVKPIKDARAKPAEKACERHNCKLAGKYRAPKGRDHENQFYFFCAAHVKEYNAQYNYFVGLKEDAVFAYQKDASHGHRPTQPMGARGAARLNPDAIDPFKLFADMPQFEQKRKFQEPAEDASIGQLSRNAFHTLGLETTATSIDIKTKFKILAKSLHPDSNGGDRSREDELANVMTAYKQLKAAGYVK